MGWFHSPFQRKEAHDTPKPLHIVHTSLQPATFAPPDARSSYTQHSPLSPTRSLAPTTSYSMMRVPHMDFGSDNMMPDPLGVGMKRHATWSTPSSASSHPTMTGTTAQHKRSPSNDSTFAVQKETGAFSTMSQHRRGSEASLSSHLRPGEVESMLIV